MKTLFILLAFLLLNACGKSGPSHPNNNQALFSCQSVAKKKLKDPFSAEFDDYRNASVTELKKLKIGSEYKITYQVMGYVFAKNSFNATIKTTYGCVITGRTGKSYPSWTVDSVVVQ